MCKRYDVTCVYDRNKSLFDSCPELIGVHIYHSIEEISEHYGKEFDLAVIGAAEKTVYEELKSILEINGISIFSTSEKCVSVEAAGCSSKYEQTRCLKNGCAENNGIAICIYTKDSEMIIETYTHYEFLLKNGTVRLFWPISDRQTVETVQFDEACVLGMEWEDNLWHFVFDCVWHVYSMESQGYKGQYIIYDSEFSRTYLKLMKVSENRVVFVDRHSDHIIYDVKNLYVPIYPGSEIAAEYITAMARAVLVNLTAEIKSKMNYGNIFVKRVGTRRVSENVEILLKEKGFITIVPEELSVEEQIACFSQADIVVCPHGAGSTNSIFMKNDAAFIELFGKAYIAPCCLETILRQDIKYRMLVENTGHDSTDERMKYKKENNYEINDILLEITLKELMG